MLVIWEGTGYTNVMKTIVTHIGPDLDAIASIWLVKMFYPGWEEAGIAFVPAGTTLGRLPPDENPEIMHVDTGFGRFDHHQTNADTCASQLIYEEIKINRTRIQNLNKDDVIMCYIVSSRISSDNSN